MKKIRKYILNMISISCISITLLANVSSASDKSALKSKQTTILKSQLDFLQLLSQEPLSLSRTDVYEQLKKIIIDLSNEKNNKDDEKKIKLILQILTKSVKIDSSLTLVQIASKGYSNNIKVYDALLVEVENQISLKYKKDFYKMKKVLIEFYQFGNG